MRSLFLVFCCVLAGAMGGGCSSSASNESVLDSTEGVSDGSEVGGDIPEEVSPEFLPFEFQRQDKGEPVPEDVIRGFTEEYSAFLNEIAYFNYVLRSSHGVAESTGKKPYYLWWGDVEAVKEGELVTFRHEELEEHGGHNIIGSHAAILASAIGAFLISGGDIEELLVTRYCQGISASMLGMVHDEDDPIRHLMTRNIITFNHEYTTHDGYEKAVDYSGWYFPYSRWNCQRFEYKNNPYWGSVWVTNVRSKDDVGHLLRTVAVMEELLERAPESNAAQACSETVELLSLFTRDIVDNGYFIRTKDELGEPFIFSQWEKPEGMRQSDDLDNFVTFDPLFPDAECNEKRACDWIGYDDGTLNDCGMGEANLWERISLENNYPNINFFRAYHIANVNQSLRHEEWDGAKQLLLGMVQRLEEDVDYDTSNISVPPDRWQADLAFALVYAASAGYPLTSDEVRLIHKYYQRTIQQLSDWPHWNLWSDSVADGVYDYKPPRSKTEDEGQKRYWIGVQNLGALIEYCWSPWKNPAGVAPVDCSKLSW